MNNLRKRSMCQGVGRLSSQAAVPTDAKRQFSVNCFDPLGVLEKNY
jgi:hypothetical protein